MILGHWAKGAALLTGLKSVSRICPGKQAVQSEQNAGGTKPSIDHPFADAVRDLPTAVR